MIRVHIFDKHPAPGASGLRESQEFDTRHQATAYAEAHRAQGAQPVVIHYPTRTRQTEEE